MACNLLNFNDPGIAWIGQEPFSDRLASAPGAHVDIDGARNYAKDEGKPLGAGLQEQASNHLKLHRSRAVVVSVREKSRQRILAGTNQGDERKPTSDEVSKLLRRRQNWGVSEVPGLAQGEPVYCLGGVRHKGGVNLIQAFAWNLGTCRPDVKGEIQVEDPRG
jgi:hypothetical protein